MTGVQTCALPIFLSEDDVRTAASVTVLGSTVSEKVFGDLDPMGREDRKSVV